MEYKQISQEILMNVSMRNLIFSLSDPKKQTFPLIIFNNLFRVLEIFIT